MRDEKITPLYERLSHDDELQSGNNSISNQKKALEGYARWNGLPNSTRFSNDGVSETCLDLSGFLVMGKSRWAGGDYCHKRHEPFGVRLSESREPLQQPDLSEKMRPYLLEVDRACENT